MMYINKLCFVLTLLYCNCSSVKYDSGMFFKIIIQIYKLCNLITSP